MGITVKEPHDLRATLIAMKASRERGENMNVWDRDIKALEDAIATIEAIRNQQRIS